MDQELIGEDRCVLEEENFMECHGGHFSNHDPAQGIGHRGINPADIEL